MKTLLYQILFCTLVTIHSWSHPGIGIVKNNKGDIFYTDTERVWKISTDGKNKKVVVPNVHTHELYIDANDNLYGEHLWYEGDATKEWGHFIWKYDINGKFSKIRPHAKGFRHHYSFVGDAFGNRYWLIKSKKGSDWMRLSASQQIEWLATIPTHDVRWQFCQKNGTFYYVDDNDLYKIVNNKRRLVAKDLDGITGEDPNRKPNNNIFGIWDDAHANMYVAVINQQSVKKITPQGEVSVVYQCTKEWMPTGGIFDNGNGLWVLEVNLKNQVRVIKVE